MSKHSKTEKDVIVIGAGPAGSTAAALLAEKGRKVIVFEKEKLPRYHIGESLMPFCWFTLNRLGLVEEMTAQGFVEKQSVQFVTQDGRQSRPFYFFQHYDHPSSTTWQVERSVFDQMIVEKARANGAEIVEGAKVRDVLRNGSGAVIGVTVHLDGETRDVLAPITIDATGRDALVMSKSRWRKRDPELKKVALWTYYKGARRDPGLDAGATTVAYIPQKGWFWYIPLRNDIVSVGIVGERDYLFREGNDPAGIFEREIAENVWIDEHLDGAKQVGEYWVTGEYSYRSEFCAADGLMLVGDAFAFLDPVFSSGVFLALKTGEMAADAADSALAAGDFTASQFDRYGEETCKGIEAMRKLVYAFYDEGFSFAELIKAHPDVRGSLTDCLIGDLSKDFGKLFSAVGEFAKVPPELPYGRKAAETAGAGVA